MSIRVKILLAIFVIFWMIIISRLYFLSIKSNKYYQELSKRNIINIEHIAPIRGDIVDTNNMVVAMNRPGFSIYLKPHLNQPSKEKQLLRDIDFITLNFPDIDREKIVKKYKRDDTPYNHKPIKVVDFIPYEDMIDRVVLFSNLENISIKPASKRFYPYDSIASHVIGYISRADQKEIDESLVAKYLGVVGKSGIEKQYDSILGGDMGKKESKVSASNREIEIIREKIPISWDVTLTVDMRLQGFIQEIFAQRSGAVIVMDIEDGSILAASSFPEYSINAFVDGISQKEWQKLINDFDHPFTNKFINGLYPPGSSTKMAVALSFLNSKLIDESEKFACSGELRLGSRKFRCWNSHGHGPIALKRAISESCDDYFYKGGLRVGIDKISTDLMRYGFGKKSGIDLPNEFIGTVPSRNWKLEKYGESWYKGETLNTVIGQGNFLATPMQVALFTAMVASGKEVVPHFVKRIGNHQINYKTREIFTPLEKSKLDIIREAMYDACNKVGGTATKYIDSTVAIAGKTGTSQVVGIPQEEKKRMSEYDLEYYQRSHAWFTSYGPYKNPKYVVTILIEHGGHGGKATGVIASRIYDKLVELGYI